MENDHKKFLSKLCRICGEIVVLKHGYRTAKDVSLYAATLNMHYAINVEMEEEDIFPKNLCNACARKIQRLQTSTTAQKAHQVSSSFVPHDSNCRVCQKHIKTVKSKDLNIAKLDRALLTIGFVKLLGIPAKYKRIFVRQTFDETRDRIITELTITVDWENSWCISVYGKPIIQNEFISELPEKLVDIDIFVDFFTKYKICQGIPGYEDVIDGRSHLQQPFPSVNNEMAAYVENAEHLELDSTKAYKFVRHKDCSIFVKHDDELPCLNCKAYITQLIKYRKRLTLEPEEKKRRTSDSSKTNTRYLTRAELIEKLQKAQSKKREAIKNVSRLQAMITEDLKTKGVSSMNKEQHDALKTIISSSECGEFAEDSPQWLLWQQQKLQASKANSKGMRWHPLIIRWCLSIYFTSPSAYKQLANKETGFLQLPSINTIRRYTNHTNVKTGFNPVILGRLATEYKIDLMDEKDRQVVVSFDEMKIKSNLVYTRRTGTLIGFTEMGDLNDEFSYFEANADNKDGLDRDLATHVIVYMVRGICSSLLYPFGYFASCGMTSSQLYTSTMEAIRVLTSLDFMVRALVSDGASPNRKLYSMMAENAENFFSTNNPHCFGMKLYFFSDVPHLLKTTRNCFENSSWNKNTRNLHFDGQDISWKHIVDVYEEDIGVVGAKGFVVNTKALGLRKLHKLTEEHINLTSRSRMTVKLAAQVLSKTMANSLQSQGLHNTISTIKFVTMIDRVFDCLNVSKVNRGRNSKEELAAYECSSDWRFDFLLKDFLENFLGRWEEQVEAKKGFTKDEKRRQLLSLQTRKGWKLTVNSFVHLSKELLGIPGVKFVLSEKFTQDPLEEHFGRQRRRGGSNDNPNLLEFGRQEIQLNLMRSEMISQIKGNTRGADKAKVKLDINDKRRLPTKKTKRKKDE